MKKFSLDGQPSSADPYPLSGHPGTYRTGCLIAEGNLATMKLVNLKDTHSFILSTILTP
jgi:hypothetical protein